MKLLFILTFKGSLEKWTKEGIANREMEFCFEYLRNNIFSEIYIFSYSPNDQEYLKKLNFDISLKNRIKLIVPDKHPKSIKDYLFHSLAINKLKKIKNEGVVICKTNQINGCWTAVLAKIIGIPMFLRCGYLLSRRFFKNKQFIKGGVSILIELAAFNICNIASVTTQDAREYASKLLITNKNKIFIAPTYVNTIIFNADITKKPKKIKIIYVGRLEPQKNVLELIRACHLAKLPITIVGRGSLENEMTELAKNLNVDLSHFQTMQNEEIAELYKNIRYFVLPSLHEGLPKVLIEAMSSEMVCIGTPTSGTLDLIQKNKTGYLCADFSAESIAETLVKATKDDQAEIYAKNAREFVLKNHSIVSYVDNEFKELKSAI